MALVAPDLRPRGAAELYDAAVHLATRGGTPLAPLALAGATPPAIAGLALASAALHGRGTLALAATFALLLLVRGVTAGAASLSAEAALSAEPIGPGEALRRALGRAPSLMAASGMGILVGWIAIPGTLLIGLGLWAPLLAGIPLVARGDAGAFTMGRVGRRRLARSPALGARALHALASLVVWVNLYTGAWLALYLGRALLGLEVAFLEELASPRNPVYLFFLVALTLVLLEPVRLSLGVLLLVDARVRSEGLDLIAAVERLSARRSRGAAAALILWAALLPSRARAAEPRDVEDLVALLREAGLAGDRRAQQGLERAKRLTGPEAKALHHFVEALRRDYEENEDASDLAKKLREGLGEIPTAGAAPSARAREAAGAILARAEFEAAVPTERAAPTPEEHESWLARLLRWLFKDRSQKESDEPPRAPPIHSPGLGGGVFRFITYALVGLALAAALLVAARGLRRAPAAAAAAGSAGAAHAPKPEDAAESALSREPMGWWSEADALAARGEYRLAVRALYLAVLSALHRRGAIDYDPSRSNWDYVRAFKGEGGALPPFRELTLRFDFAWYGRRGGDAPGYALVRALAGPLLEREASARA